jgi:hypothetical protein
MAVRDLTKRFGGVILELCLIAFVVGVVTVGWATRVGRASSNAVPTRKMTRRVAAPTPAPPAAFDQCVQDDTTKNFCQFNSTTGDYVFGIANCATTITGTGTISKSGCLIVLTHNPADRRVTAKVDTCSKRGSAQVQRFSPPLNTTIMDRNVTNNVCGCAG